MSGADIYVALMERVATLSIGSPALPISYPETTESYDPPADGMYLEVLDFPNRPFWEGLTDGRVDQGLLQINVVWPQNEGLVAPKAAADAVIAHFPKGLRLGSVKITAQPWQGSPLIGDHDVKVAVTIPWKA